jgi:hypothetical protein
MWVGPEVGLHVAQARCLHALHPECRSVPPLGVFEEENGVSRRRWAFPDVDAMHA